jgi:hypothetical protein
MIYFGVPAGIAEFTIEIGGQGSETVNADIYLEKQKIAYAKSISAPRKFKISCGSSSKMRYGSINFSRAVEDVMLKIPVPLLPIIAMNKSELMIQNDNPTP